MFGPYHINSTINMMSSCTFFLVEFSRLYKVLPLVQLGKMSVQHYQCDDMITVCDNLTFYTLTSNKNEGPLR